MSDTVADVVIVGAGTAGCVLAARLSEEPSRRVLLVEAGSDASDPALAGLDYLHVSDRSRFWADVPVVRVAGQPARPYGSGRGLGGSAAVNGMVAMPPTEADLAPWGPAGGPGWSWAAVAPTLDALSPGWMPTVSADTGPLERALGAAAEERSLGTYRHVALERVGQSRASVVERILGPARARSNLSVRGEDAVRRVLIERGQVAGIELAGGTYVEARQVVVATGAIRSPLLLAASGLGRIASAGRLVDHPSLTFTLALRDGATRAALQTAGVLRWRTASGGLAEVLPIDRVGTGLAAIAVAVMDPVSTGSIVIGADGSSEVSLGMLGAPRDRAVMREAIDGALRLLAAPSMAALVTAAYTGTAGAPAQSLADATDVELDAAVAATGPYLHAACSLPIGSVLDQWGRVPDVAGLRVVDASAFPVLPPLAPNASVTLLAAHIAAHWSAP